MPFAGDKTIGKQDLSLQFSANFKDKWNRASTSVYALMLWTGINFCKSPLSM
jgi:hypothetical protein